MAEYAFVTADVFTDRVFGGNPLAVITDARGLDSATMMQITREFNYSETVFVLPPQNPAHTRQVRIFTPGAEMPFAGHPTVGTAFVLAAIGAVPLTGPQTRIVLEEGVGPVPVTIWAEKGQPVFTQLSAARMPQFGPPPPAVEQLAALLGLEPNDLLASEFSPQAVSCEVPFLFVPLRSRAAVARIRLNRAVWEQTLARYWAPEVFAFCFETETPGADLHARMFAPKLGIGEDPATGAAATALAGYLSARDLSSRSALRWTVEQGFEMGRPSILEVEADRQGGQVSAIRVGGRSVLVSSGTLRV